MRQLATGRWIAEHRNVLITGATGVGKTYVACALGHIARNHHRVGPQVGDHPLDRLDLADVRQAAEVRIGEVEDLNGHDSTCTVYVSVAVPLAGTFTRKRDSLDDSFSAVTLLSVICQVPKCVSRTSTVTVSGLALVSVTR